MVVADSGPSLHRSVAAAVVLVEWASWVSLESKNHLGHQPYFPQVGRNPFDWFPPLKQKSQILPSCSRNPSFLSLQRDVAM
ncbi:hypothetical protein IC582_009334 [Cucumis melo]